MLGQAIADIDHANTQRLDGSAVHRLMKRFHALQPELSNVTLTSGGGQMLLSTLAEPGSVLPSVKEMPFFKELPEQLQPGEQLMLGRPIRSVMQGRWILPFRYHILQPDGRIRYSLVAAIPVEALQVFWQDAPIARRIVVGVIRDDGYVLTRYPPSLDGEVDLLYAKPRSGALITALRAASFPSSGYISGASSLDPRVLLQAYRRLRHFPATLFVTVDRAALYTVWWAKVRVSYLLLMLICGSSWWVYRHLARRQQVWLEKQLDAAQTANQLAYYDALTGLPNRTLLLNRLNQQLITARRTRQASAVMFLDLDNFKNINDARGHAVGDQVLRAVAQRLLKLLREGDTVARVGGDEFVLLVSGLSPDLHDAAEMALLVASKVRQTLEQPVVVDGVAYTANGSIGVTLFPKKGDTVDELLREADTAMYRAKNGGRNRIEFFEAEMKAEVEERYALEEDLAQALDRGELSMVIQPQSDPQGRVCGAEMLMRWHHPVRGAIPPSTFIALAEQSSLIYPLGDWVLAQGCAISEQLARAGRPLPLSINISPVQFRQADFVAKVKAQLAQRPTAGNQLIFEVTESLIIKDVENTVARMQELAELGIRFSIDDFGTGYSSLAYLKRLPLYELKIDRSFIRDTPGDADDVAIVRLILSTARHLRLRVVAEGVETHEQAAFLTSEGCDLLQGYLLCRPTPAADWLANQPTGASEA
jgi:diguanylate cyclase (GGDEF)-like protein